MANLQETAMMAGCGAAVLLCTCLACAAQRNRQGSGTPCGGATGTHRHRGHSCTNGVTNFCLAALIAVCNCYACTGSVGGVPGPQPFHVGGATGNREDQPHRRLATEKSERALTVKADGTAPPKTYLTAGDNGPMPKLTVEDRALADFFNLGSLQQFRTAAGTPVRGHFTFSNAPNGHSYTKEQLPFMLMGLELSRLLTEDTGGSNHPAFTNARSKISSRKLLAEKPQKEAKKGRCTNTEPTRWSLSGTGHTKRFSLIIAVGVLSFNFPKYYEFWSNFCKANYQPLVLGWDWTKVKKQQLPAFYAFRFTPRPKELGFVNPPARILNILKTLSRLNLIKKLLGFGWEAHVDIAVDIPRSVSQREPVVSIYLRIEGNMKINILGAMWQAARKWIGLNDGVDDDQNTGGGGGGGHEGDAGHSGNRSEDAPQDFEAFYRPRRTWWAYAYREAERAANHERTTIDLRLRREVEALSRNEGAYGAAADLQMKGEVDINNEINSYRITFPMIVAEAEPAQGRERRRFLQVEPQVAHLLEKMGVPIHGVDNESADLTPEQREHLDSLSLGHKVLAQLVKSLQVVPGFFNFNLSLGVGFHGFYLDGGFVLPLVILTHPWGALGANTPKRFTKSVVVPIWVYGASVQILGDRNDKNENSTAGIITR